MKTKFLFFILLITQIIAVHAQMDDKFYYPKKDIIPNTWRNSEEIKLNVDKDTISAILLKPAGNPKATIFYFYGAGGNSSYYLPLTLVLVQDNFQVVMVDFRGYGKSTGTPTHNNIATDGQQFFEMLIKRQDIKNTKKIFYGISIGTQIATLLAKDNQEKIEGLILEGTIASFTDIAAFSVPQYKDYLQKNYISPYAAKEDIKSIDKISKIFIHSREDKDVPYLQGEAVFINAPEPKIFIEFSGEHLYGLKYKKEEILQKINEILEPNESIPKN